MDNYLTKLSKTGILLTNIGHGQNLDKHWTETGQNLDICQKVVQILSNPPFYRSTENRLCTSDLRGRGPWHAALDGGGGWVPLSSPLFAKRVDISIVSPSAPVGRFVDSISRSIVTLSFSTLISSSLPTCCA